MKIVCKVCSIDKQSVEFYKGKKVCKSCVLEKLAVARRAKAGYKARRVDEDRTCIDCKVYKPKADFYNKTYSRCKGCHSKAVMANQKANSKYYGKYRIKYAINNKEKIEQWLKNREIRWEQTHGRSFREFENERQRKRIFDNPLLRERRRQRLSAYRLNNLSKIREQQAAYYLRNRDKILAKAREKWKQRKGSI